MAHYCLKKIHSQEQSLHPGGMGLIDRAIFGPHTCLLEIFHFFILGPCLNRVVMSTKSIGSCRLQLMETAFQNSIIS
jgi:hypothetical protein